MATRDIDNVLNSLETKAGDELSFLAETGPEYFSTGHLLRLKGQWQTLHRLYHQLHSLLLRVAAVSPIWLVLWIGCSALGWAYPSYFFLALFPFSFLLFFAGLLTAQYVFKGHSRLEEIGTMIDQELNRRKIRQRDR